MDTPSEHTIRSQIDWAGLGHTGSIFKPEDSFLYVCTYVDPCSAGLGRPNAMSEAGMLEFLDQGQLEPRLLCLDKRNDKLVTIQLYCNVRRDDPSWKDPIKVMQCIPAHPTILKPIEIIKNFPRTWYDAIVFEAPAMGGCWQLLAEINLMNIQSPPNEIPRLLPASFVYRIFRDTFSAIFDGANSGLVVSRTGAPGHGSLYDVKDCVNLDSSNPILPRVVSGLCEVVPCLATDNPTSSDFREELKATKVFERMITLAEMMLLETKDNFQLYCLRAKDPDHASFTGGGIHNRYRTLDEPTRRSFAKDAGLAWPPYSPTLVALWEVIADGDRQPWSRLDAILKLKNLLPAIKHWEDEDLRERPLDKNHWLVVQLDKLRSSVSPTWLMIEEEIKFKQKCQWINCEDVPTRWFERCYMEYVCDGAKGWYYTSPGINSCRYFDTECLEYPRQQSGDIGQIYHDLAKA